MISYNNISTIHFTYQIYIYIYISIIHQEEREPHKRYVKISKLTISYHLKLLGLVVIYHGIRASGPKFKTCLHSTSYLSL